jgi:tRNA threonylcarbamoyl adenosine modification protein YeaZ
MCVIGGSILFVLSYAFFYLYSILKYKIKRNQPCYLFIDTCFKDLNIGIFQNNSFFNIKFSIPTNNNLTDITIDYINKMLKKINIRPSEIKKIYLTNGPGSFTGCRIGNIITKVWKDINEDIEIFKINSLKLQTTKENQISILDAKGGKFYTSVYKKNSLIGEIELKNEKEILEIANNDKLDIIKDNEGINIFENFFFHLKNNDFISSSCERLKPLYVKKAI